jgi:hypothetical protein
VFECGATPGGEPEHLEAPFAAKELGHESEGGVAAGDDEVGSGWGILEGLDFGGVAGEGTTDAVRRHLGVDPASLEPIGDLATSDAGPAHASTREGAAQALHHIDRGRGDVTELEKRLDRDPQGAGQPEGHLGRRHRAAALDGSVPLAGKPGEFSEGLLRPSAAEPVGAEGGAGKECHSVC